MRDLPEAELSRIDYWSLTLDQQQLLRDEAKRRGARARAETIDRLFAALIAWFQRPGVIIGLDPSLGNSFPLESGVRRVTDPRLR